MRGDIHSREEEWQHVPHKGQCFTEEDGNVYYWGKAEDRKNNTDMAAIAEATFDGKPFIKWRVNQVNGSTPDVCRIEDTLF
jgi:hypothetical protein